MKTNQFLNVDEVAGYIGISVPMAYKIIRQLNDELSQQGYITVAVRISRTYFEQKVYGAHAAKGA